MLRLANRPYSFHHWLGLLLRTSQCCIYNLHRYICPWVSINWILFRGLIVKAHPITSISKSSLHGMHNTCRVYKGNNFEFMLDVEKIELNDVSIWVNNFGQKTDKFNYLGKITWVNSIYPHYIVILNCVAAFSSRDVIVTANCLDCEHCNKVWQLGSWARLRWITASVGWFLVQGIVMS